MDANDAVNIPKGHSGPKTEAGKAKSSRNAIRTMKTGFSKIRVVEKNGDVTTSKTQRKSARTLQPRPYP